MDFASKMAMASTGDAFEDMEVEPASRRRRREDSSAAPAASAHRSQDVEALTRELNTLKLVSNTAQKQRLTMSIIVWTLLVPIALVESAIKAAKQFGDANRGTSKHGKGSPHVHVYRHFLTSLLDLSKDAVKQATGQVEEHCNQAIKIVSAHLEAFIQSGPKKGYFHVRQCRARTTRNESKGILIFEVSQLLENPRDVTLAIVFLAEYLGSEVLEGTEAMSDLERAAQKDIETIQAALKTKM